MAFSEAANCHRVGLAIDVMLVMIVGLGKETSGPKPGSDSLPPVSAKDFHSTGVSFEFKALNRTTTSLEGAKF